MQNSECWKKRRQKVKDGSRGGSRAAATSKMERFVIIVNGWKPLTIITKHSILDVAADLDPPLWSATEADKHFTLPGHDFNINAKSVLIEQLISRTKIPKETLKERQRKFLDNQFIDCNS